MKLRYISEQEPRMLVHRFLALAFSTLFLSVCIRMFHDFFSFFAALDFFFTAVLICGGIVSLSLQALFAKERVRGLAKAQALIWALLIVYFIHVLVSSVTLVSVDIGLSRFKPTVSMITMLFALAANWQLTAGIVVSFMDRERFLRAVVGKKEHQLFQAIRDDWHLANEATVSGSRLSFLCIWTTGVLAFFLFLGFLFKVQISAVTFVFLVLFLIVALFMYVLVRIYADEQRFLTFGLDHAFSFTRYRLRAILPCIGGGVFFAFLVSRERALLPPRIFILLYEALLRFFRLFSRSSVPARESIPLSEPLSMGDFSAMVPLAMNGDSVPNPLLPYFKYVLGGVVSIALLYFLFGFLFKPELRSFFRSGRLKGYVLSFIRAVRNLFSFKFAKGRRQPTLILSTLSQGALSKKKERKKKVHSRRKKREIGHLTAQFIRMLRWGEESGLKRAAHQAPAEYAAALALLVPDVAEPLRCTAELFEKALYSKGLLTMKEQALFSKMVTEVLSTSPQK